MADINIGGSISTTGTSILGHASVVFTSDADHTLSVAEYTNNFLEVTASVSLTATRNLFAPLVQGQTFIVQNNTSNEQSIQVIGISGTGVTITNGTTRLVTCDGTNYLIPVASSGGSTTVPWQGTTITTTIFTLSPARDQRWLVDSHSNNIIVKAPTPGDGNIDGDTFTLHWIATSGTNTVGVDGVASGFHVEDPSNPSVLNFTGSELPSLGCTVTWEWRALDNTWYLLSNSTTTPPLMIQSLGTPFSPGTVTVGNDSGYILFTGTMAGDVVLQLSPGLGFQTLAQTEWILDFTQVNFNTHTITDIQPTTTFLSWNGGPPNGSITAAGTNPQTNLYRFTLSPGTGFLYATIMTP
jgi:hypothetical protein